MPDEQSEDVDDIKFTPWDRRVIAAIDVAHSARLGVLILRVLAAVVAIAAIVGTGLYTFSDPESSGQVPSTPIDRQTIGYFLAGISNPLAFAGVVFALSYLVQIAASRLDIDIVLSDEDETDPDAKS